MLQEVVVSTSAPAPNTQSTGNGSILFHDIQSGASLASFKHTNAAKNCTALIPTREAQGGLMLAVQPDKALLNIYSFQKDQISQKFVLPERLSCVTIDRRGQFCAAGTPQGRIYLWEIASGIMYNSWEAHYRQVTVLRFTPDGEALLSGSEDSGISVWSVFRLLDDGVQNENPQVYAHLSDHTLPITDIACGFGPFPSCRVLSASTDHSVKIWDLSSKSLLTTFQFPHAVACIAWDLTERLFFAASTDGSIHQVNLFRTRANKSGGYVAEAIGGAGVNDVLLVRDDDSSTTKRRLISVGEPVTALSFSLTGALLLAGTALGNVHVYDVPSHQLLRTINAHPGPGLAVTHLTALLKPPDLVGHVQLGGDKDGGIPVLPILPFQRMREARPREAHEVTMMLPHARNSTHESVTTYSREELLRDWEFFVKPRLTTPTVENDALSAPPLDGRVTELADEVARLKSQLARAKGINDVMWETLTQTAAAQGKELAAPDQAHDSHEDAADERERKRGKTKA
ncbi:WD40 repeat-like protein [Lactarius akahatsu]|uniref:Pre-rRNA-processing protein IPI3 n=1 Tax=Lactarius akahatsu TaxID=416441 RepID=A0AAD4LS68_9AGAM|nr:WD40 repeat-like protein [Lactarius akahatsu]